MSELERKEKLEALNAALLLILRAEENGEPMPDHPFRYLDTWDGVKANLMLLCHDLWMLRPKEESCTG